MAGGQNAGEDKQPGEKKDGDEDYMSAAFVKTSIARTTLKRKLDKFDEEDEEEFASASLFSTTSQTGQQVEPFCNLDYDEEEEDAKKDAADDGEEGEDYMSANFLTNFEDVKPGIRSTASYQRMMRVSANRDAAEESNARAPKKMRKGELEKHRLKEGLGRPIDENSKGYELLAKMGFKPGMSLGKQRGEGSEDTRIKEPIAIQTQSTSARAGLGHGVKARTGSSRLLTSSPAKCSDDKPHFPRARAGAQKSSTSVTCPECLNDTAYFTQVQARSADEPMSIFYTCTECLYHWRD